MSTGHRNDEPQSFTGRGTGDYRLLVENLRDVAVFMTDPCGRVTSWNPGVEHVLGYAEAEFLNRPARMIFTSDYLPRVRPFPRVRVLFERLKADGLQIALASSAKEEELEQHKKSLRVENLLGASTSADAAERSKPHPDIFHAALARLRSVRPEEAIVVGDTPYDVEAAGKAGMRTVALLSGGFAEEALRGAGAVAVYQDVSDLLHNYEESPLAKDKAGAARGQRT